MSRLENALEACLQAVSHGEPAERALGRYPHLRQELEPLVMASIAIRDSCRLVAPASLRVAGRTRILNRIAARRVQARPSFLDRLLMAPRAVAAAITLAALSGGAVVASANALPDEPLYPVKRAVESVKIAVTPPSDRTDLFLNLAARRLDEGTALAERGQAAAAERSAEAYGNEIERALESMKDVNTNAATLDAAADRFAEHLDQHAATMSEVLDRVPPQARPAIQKAIDESKRGQERALELHQSRSQPGLTPSATGTVAPARTVAPPQTGSGPAAKPTQRSVPGNDGGNPTPDGGEGKPASPPSKGQGENDNGRGIATPRELPQPGSGNGR